MKNLDDNYYDVYEMIIKLKEKKHDIEKDIMDNGIDGGQNTDWEYLSGYNQCIKDLENLVKEEDNV